MSKRNIITLILFIIYLGVVAYLCFGRFDNLPSVKWSYLGIPTDKIVHFCMFFPFPILGFMAFDYLTKKPWQALLGVTVVFLLGSLVAAGTEFGQSLIKYRSCDLADLKADLLALTISSVITLTIDIFKMRRQS